MALLRPGQGNPNGSVLRMLVMTGLAVHRLGGETPIRYPVATHGGDILRFIFKDDHPMDVHILRAWRMAGAPKAWLKVMAHLGLEHLQSYGLDSMHDAPYALRKPVDASRRKVITGSKNTAEKAPEKKTRDQNATLLEQESTFDHKLTTLITQNDQPRNQNVDARPHIDAFYPRDHENDAQDTQTTTSMPAKVNPQLHKLKGMFQ